MEENKVTTIEELKDAYGSVFFMSEENLLIIEVLVAIALSVKFDGDPIWLMIIGGSSSGKSELIGTLSKIKWNTEISTMTENTFLSGMKASSGQETSLLLKIGRRGLLTFKDYTTILSMRAEKKDLIVSQMREIFDGHLTKQTGNGGSLRWPISGKGKINCILAVTPSIYTKEGESAGMGRRALYFVMPAQDEREMCRRQRANANTIDDKREMLQVKFKEYCDYMDKVKPNELPMIDDAFAEELLDLSIFVTQARTPVERDYQGKLKLVHEKEKATRMYGQIEVLARTLQWINGGELKPQHKKLLFKMALDGIPIQRRKAIDIMARYTRVKTSSAAAFVNMPSDWMLYQIEEINWLMVVDRIKRPGASDVYAMKPEYRKLMTMYADIPDLNRELIYSDDLGAEVDHTFETSVADLREYGSISPDEAFETFGAVGEDYDKVDLEEMYESNIQDIKDKMEAKKLEKKRIDDERKKQLQDKIDEENIINSSKIEF
jgi:hypothetical protein